MSDSAADTWPGLDPVGGDAPANLAVPQRWLPDRLAPEPFEATEVEVATFKDHLNAAEEDTALAVADPWELCAPPGDLAQGSSATVVMSAEAINSLREATFVEEDNTDPMPLSRGYPPLGMAGADPLAAAGPELTEVTTLERPARGSRPPRTRRAAPDTLVEIDESAGPAGEERLCEEEAVPLPSRATERAELSDEVELPVGPRSWARRWLGPLIIVVILVTGGSAAYLLQRGDAPGSSSGVAGQAPAAAMGGN